MPVIIIFRKPDIFSSPSVSLFFTVSIFIWYTVCALLSECSMYWKKALAVLLFEVRFASS